MIARTAAVAIPRPQVLRPKPITQLGAHSLHITVKREANATGHSARVLDSEVGLRRHTERHADEVPGILDPIWVWESVAQVDPYAPVVGLARQFFRIRLSPRTHDGFTGYQFHKTSEWSSSSALCRARRPDTSL